MALVLTGLAACVSVRDCRDGAPLAALECQAARGDKVAELDLGRRLETGSGLPADPARAARLYRAAGAFTPGTQFIYVPGVDKQPGYVMPVTSGPDQAGLPEAQYRLGVMYVDGRGVKADRRRGLKLIEAAAKAGFAPAKQALEGLGLSPSSP